MAKFYVESGSVQAVVDCLDVEGAALWAVNMVMDETDAFDFLDEEDAVFAANIQDQHHLDETIRISEQGFGRSDANVIETASALHEWFELCRAISVMTANW